MKAKDIHALSDKELEKQLKDGRAELFNLRFQMATSQLDNTARVCTVKRDIARVQTEMRLRELANSKQTKKSAQKAEQPKAAPAVKEADKPASTKTKEETAEPKTKNAEVSDAQSDSKKVAGA